MSASKEKKKRQSGEVLDKKQKELESVRAKKRKNKILAIIITVAAVLLIALAIVINSNVIYTTGTALTVGDHSFTAAEVNYFYYSAYLNEYQSYGEYASYIIDSSKALSEQDYSEGYTWDDHFRETAIANIRDTVMLYDQAVAAGFTLSEETLAEIDNNIANYSIMASYYGYKSLDAYCAANFGNGVNEKVVRDCMELVYLANDYREYKKASFEYSDSELDAYYDENKDSYDVITYRMYYVSGSEDDDTTMEEAKEKADYLTSSTTDLEFAERVYEICKDSQKETYANLDTTKHSYSGGSISSNYNEWLTDESRKTGDTTAIESISETTSARGYYVVYFIDRDSNNYQSADIRYAFIQADEADDGTITTAALALAKQTAESAYNDWVDGGKDENSFINIAMNYSDDTDTKYDGGLDEYVNKADVGTYGEEMLNWVLSSTRKPGHVETFEVSNGYYLVYFVERNEELYSRTLAREDMQDAAYDEWDAAQLESYPAVNGATMFKVGE